MSLTTARELQTNLKKELAALEKERAKAEKALRGDSLIGSGLEIQLAKERTKLSKYADFGLKDGKIDNPKVREPMLLSDYRDQLSKCQELESRISVQKESISDLNSDIRAKSRELTDATQRVQKLEDTQSARSHDLIKREQELPAWSASRNLKKQQDYANELDEKGFKEGMKKDVGALLIGGGVVGLMFGVPLIAIALLVIIGGVMLNSGLKGEKKAENREAYSAKMTGHIIDGEVENRRGMALGG